MCRIYQDALSRLGHDSRELDYMGIYATHFNAHFVSLVFGLEPDHKVVLKPENLRAGEKLHISGAGLKPGQSSDAAAVNTALEVNSSTVINMSNITHVYSADPDIDPDAEALDRLTWSEYMNLIPHDWSPGLSTPFDPIASKRAYENNIAVHVIGSDVNNLAGLLDGNDFIGSTIS